MSLFNQENGKQLLRFIDNEAISELNIPKDVDWGAEDKPPFKKLEFLGESL